MWLSSGDYSWGSRLPESKSIVRVHAEGDYVPLEYGCVGPSFDL